MLHRSLPPSTVIGSGGALVGRQVTKTYRTRGVPPVEALRGLDLEVRKGQRVSLLGRNGAGKTTFLKIASTLLEPTGGEVEVFGIDIVHDPEAARPLIAVVPQEGKPFFHLTPREQIYTYLRARGFTRETSQSRCTAVLESMGLLEVADRLCVTLSGGQQQRTMVATVLATEAPLLFLDEPTLGMDPFARRSVWAALRELTRKGSTLLLTTHYLDEAENLSDHVYIVNQGRVAAHGSSEDLKRSVGGTIRITLAGVAANDPRYTSFGKCIIGDGVLHIITEPPRVPEILSLALASGTSVTVGPVTLEEAFLELVGGSIEHDE